MKTFVSQRHKFKFYLSLILGSLFFLAMGTALLVTFIHIPDKTALKPKEYLVPVISAGMYFMAVYTIYKYCKNAPKIRVADNYISIGKEQFPLADLAHVELTGKKNFPYFISFPMEATTLQFNNGQTKYLFDDMYENAWELKSLLREIVREPAVQQVLYADPLALHSDHFEVYKGNQFTSFRGISLWGMLCFLAFALSLTHHIHATGAFVPIATFTLLWFFLQSWLMYYFKVSSEYLVVKNHNFPWSNKTYLLADIEEVVFETQGKMPNCLRVITKDYRSKLYRAGTLRDKTWLALKDKLEGYGIKVRNECI